MATRRTMTGIGAVLLASLLIPALHLLSAPTAGAAEVGAFTDVARSLTPTSIVTGPDGNLWFTNEQSRSVGRVTPAGIVTTFSDPELSSPRAITVGADGNLWILDGDGVARMTPNGAVTRFSSPDILPSRAITAGPDGNLWFTSDTNSGTIGRITLDGTITRFFFGDGTSRFPTSITSGPDGNLWVTGHQFVGRMTPSGQYAAVASGPGLGTPRGITLGPDGNLWTTDDLAAGAIRRVTPAGVVTTYTGPSISQPTEITAGPDGALWFVNVGDGSIGRITTAGASSSYTDPTISFTANNQGDRDDITLGPDGALWFTNSGSGSLGRITTAGAVSRVTFVSQPRDLVLGPDGNMWFTDAGTDVVGRVTQAGSTTTFGGPGVLDPDGIAAGPDGNLWFTNSGTDSIGRVTPAGVVSNFTGTGISSPGGIAVGPDGNLWFTNSGSDSIGRVTPAGVVSNFTGTGISSPQDVALGPDGNLWFTNRGNNSIGRITSGGTVSNYSGTVVGFPEAIAAGPDGALWYTGNGAIGRITTAGSMSTFTGPGVSWAFGITAGADGNLWYGTLTNDTIGRMTPAGEATAFADPSMVREPTAVAAGPDGSIWFTSAFGIGRVQAVATTVPGPPGHVVATAGSQSALVSWAAPADQGDSAITGYAVTASPGGAGCSTTGALSCVVGGLTDGTDYTFTVTATNGAGDGASSAPSAPVTPAPVPEGTWFHPVTPARLVDSRPSGPAVGGYTTPWTGPLTRDVTIGGVGPVPADAAAVVLNVTVVSRSGGGYLTVWPAGQPKPVVSSLNYAPGQTVANQVTVKLGTDGGLSIDNQFGTVDVIVDVNGYYDAGEGNGFAPLTPARVVDSRPSGPAVGGYTTPWPGGATRDVQIGGLAGVPDDADAVVLNVTAVGPSTGSYLTIWPTGQAKPLASSLNFAAGQVVPNAVTVKLGTAGKVSISNEFGSVDVIVDVAGFFRSGTGSAFHPIVPVRIQDSRPPTTVGPYATPWSPGLARTVQVTGTGDVPPGALALVGNVTAVSPTSGSYVTVWPTWNGRPFTSTLNFATGQTVPNAATVKLGPGGSISVVNAFGAVDVIVDANGWYG